MSACVPVRGVGGGKLWVPIAAEFRGRRRTAIIISVSDLWLRYVHVGRGRATVIPILAASWNGLFSRKSCNAAREDDLGIAAATRAG